MDLPHVGEGVKVSVKYRGKMCDSYKTARDDWNHWQGVFLKLWQTFIFSHRNENFYITQIMHKVYTVFYFSFIFIIMGYLTC